MKTQTIEIDDGTATALKRVRIATFPSASRTMGGRIISGAFIPMWAFIMLNLESRVLWRSRTWVRVVAALCAVGVGLLLPLQIMICVSNELLSPFRPVDDSELQTIWGVNVFLAMAGMFWMAHRAEKRRWPVREERGVSGNTSGQ